MNPEEVKVEPLYQSGDKYLTFKWALTRTDSKKLDVKKISIDLSGLGETVDKDGLDEQSANRFKVEVSAQYKEGAGGEQTRRVESWRTNEVAFSKKRNYVASKPTAASSCDEIVIALCNVKPKAKLVQRTTLSSKISLDATEKDLSFELAPVEPNIRKFRAEPSIISENCGAVTLVWDCDGAVRINQVNGSEIPISKTDASERRKIVEVKERVTFELVATREKMTRVARTTVKVVDTVLWRMAGRAWGLMDQLTGLCVSPDGETLFAIVRSQSEGLVVYGTPDGFSSWEKLVVSDWKGFPSSRQPGLTTVPVAAVQLNGQPVLVFAGGSKIEHGYTEASNAVSLVRLRDQEWEDHTAPWKARAGHICLATHQDASQKLWIIGGLDRSGGKLNDAWVSTNGRDWTNPNNANQPWPIPDWEGRGLFGAAVKEEKKKDGLVTKSEIWLGGGFQRPDGEPCNDLGYFDTETLRYNPVYPQLVSGGYPCGMAFVVLSEDLYAAGTYQGQNELNQIVYKTIFGKVKKNPEGPLAPGLGEREDWSHDWRQSKIEAVSFNGCIWVCSLRPGSDPDQVKSSGLYYWVPGRQD